MMQYFRFILILISILLFNFNAIASSTANVVEGVDNTPTKIVKNSTEISASILGNATVCLNDASPAITFTGFNGTPPYTFTYSLNNGINTPIKTIVGNSINLDVPTNQAGIFIYTLKSVSDATNTIVNQTGTVSVRVNPIPVFDFTFLDNQCSSNSILFTSLVVGAGDYTYEWDFGDANTSTEKSPLHKYLLLPGVGVQTFTVSLKVKNSISNCFVIKTKQITVSQVPDATISATGSGKFSNGVPVFEICSNNTSPFRFTNVSTTASSNTAYILDWGDGSTIFESNTWTTLDHDYKVGKWNVTYTVTGPNGCSIVQPYIVFVGAGPSVTLGKPANTNICVNNTLTFPITGTRNNPPGTTYTVLFSDGSAPEVYNNVPPISITHTFTKPSCGVTSEGFENAFSAKVIVENPCGKIETVVAPIYVSSKPNVDFTLPSLGCTTNQICITNTTAEGTIATANGCVKPNMVWSVSPSVGVTLASGSYGNDNGSANQSAWITGSEAICPIFSIPGTYTITLKVGNLCGVVQRTKTICINPPINPQFNVDFTSGCAPLVVTATNSSDTSAICKSPTFTWDVSYTAGNCGTTSSYFYANGTSSTSKVPVFQFVNPGKYTIQLSVASVCGTKVTTKEIEVKQLTTVTIQDIPDLCGASTINPAALVNSCAPTASYSWSFPGGTPSTSNTQNPGPISYASPGNYDISLSLNSECGNTITANKSFTIKPIPAITNVSLSQTVCSGLSTNFIAISSDKVGTTFDWKASASAGISGFLASGNSDTIPSQIITTSQNIPGIVSYEITPFLNGCEGAKVNYIININPVAIFTSQPISSAVCQDGIPTTLSVSYSNVAAIPSYQWYQNILNNTTSGTSIAGATNSSYIPSTSLPGTLYYYCVIDFAVDACSSIVSNTASVEVSSPPTIALQPQLLQDICVGGTISNPLTAGFSGGSGTVSYQWFSNTVNSNIGGTVITGANSINYNPPVFTASGHYYYYLVISFTGGNCNSITSNVSEINVVNDPVVSLQPLVTQTLCQGSASTPITVGASGGVGIYAYQWYSNTLNSTLAGIEIAGATNATYTPITSSVGTTYYYCLITQPNGLGCNVTSFTSEVIVIPAPTISEQPISSNVCQGGISPTLKVSYINGLPAISYQWYSNAIDNVTTGTLILGANSDTYTPSSAVVGINYYYCIITLPAGLCDVLTSNTAKVSISEIPVIVEQPTFSQDICIGGTTALPLTVKYSGGAGTVSYQWYSNIVNSNVGGTQVVGATNSSFTPIPFTNTGTFYFYVVVNFSASGCTSITSNPARINVVSDPSITVQPILTQSLCQNTVPTSLSVAAMGGLGVYSYQWYINDVNATNSGTLIVGAISDTYTPSTTVVGKKYYYCNIKQPAGLGCEVTSNTSEIIVVATPTFITQPASSSICEGGTPTQLTVSFTGGLGTTSYQWYRNLANNNTTGTAIVGATTDKYNAPVPVLGTIYYYCTITLSEGGCTSLTSSVAQVTVNQNPMITPKSVSICSGNAFSIVPSTLSGDIVPFGTTYTWATPSISPLGTISGASSQLTPQTSISQTLINNSNNLATVTYLVTPISGTCSGPDFNVIVTVNPAINIAQTVKNISCLGADDGSIQVDLSGGVPYGVGAPYLISWTGPNAFTSAATILTGLKAGIYNLSVTDAVGCPILKTYNIVEPQAIAVAVDRKKDIDCFGSSSGEILINVSGGTQPYSYNWTKNGIAFANTEDLTNIGTGAYEVTVTDVNNCTPQKVSFTIVESPEFIVAGTITHIINNTAPSSGAIVLNVSGGVQPYSYSWSNGSKTKDVNNLLPGKYLVNVVDGKNCVKNLQFEVFKQTPIVIAVNTINDFNCTTKEAVKISTAYVTGGIPPYILTWNRGTVSGANNQIMTTGANGIVDLQVVDSYGLTATYTFQLETFVGFDYHLIDCQNYYSQFNAIDPAVDGQSYTYLWDFGDGQTSTLKNVLHKYNTFGNYNVSLTITSPLCSSDFKKTIGFQPLPKLQYPDELQLCPNDSVIQYVKNTVTRKWSDGSTADSIIIKKQGDYSVICSSKDGCLDTLLFSVKSDLLNFKIYTDKEEVQPDNKPIQFTTDDIQFATYYWDFGDGTVSDKSAVSHVYNVNKAGYYDVKLSVVNPNGCTETDTKRLWIVNNAVNNYFTPNATTNSLFMEGWQIKVYNRNGVLLYEGQNGWDGTYNGKMVAKGTYFYSMTYISQTGPTSKEGYVMVIR